MPNNPAYRIVTSNLVLRCWQPQDAPLLRAAFSPENVAHLRTFLYWAENEPRSLPELTQWLRVRRAQFDLDQDYTYAIFNCDESRVLGGSGLHLRSKDPLTREIGYWIHVDYLRRGYAHEAAAALTRVAFEHDGVHRVEIQCDPQNYASAGIPRKLGYTLEATLRARMRKPSGEWRDTLVWSLFAEDYPKTPCARVNLQAFDALGNLILGSPHVADS